MRSKFKPKSPYVLFGKDADLKDDLWMPIMPEGRDEQIIRIIDDYRIAMDFALDMALGSFDMYKNYSFELFKWEKALKAYEKIVCAKSFDEIFEYVTGADYKTNTVKDKDNLYYINHVGKNLWDNREIYKAILSDLKKWTKTLCRDCKINIYGY